MQSHLDLIQTLLAATVLLLLVALLDLVLRKRSAALRHGLWSATMFGLLLLPFVQPCLPSLMQFGTSDASVMDVAWNHVVPPIAPNVNGVQEPIRHSRTGGNPDERLASLDPPPAWG